MAVRTTVTIEDDQLGPAVRAALAAIDPGVLRSLNAVGARAAQEAARHYHRDFDQRGGWSRFKRGTQFGTTVARAWGVKAVTAAGAELVNAAPHLGFKIRGGTIRPKRKKALTVPLIEEARGRFARTYERVTGNKLFVPHGTNVLAYKTGDGTFTNVYALVQSTTHKAVRGAMPPDEVFTTPFVDVILRRLDEALG